MTPPFRWCWVWLALVVIAPGGWASESVVHAVYFSSPSCPFCALVSERDLVPLQEQHGPALQLHVVDTSTAEGSSVLQALWDTRSMPPERRGVPTVVLADQVLVGAREIPQHLPQLVEELHAAGGADWPDIPGLRSVPDATLTPAQDPPGVWSRLTQDLPGNLVALALLATMIGIGVASARPARWQARLSERTSLGTKVGVALMGLGAAAYLTWGEWTERDLVCGPIGQCNVVQHSDMASLWGLFPLALLGALAYLALLAVYAGRAFGPPRWAHSGVITTFALTAFGFAFSMLLTFWQPFVIGATCGWCLLSAISMTGSFLLGVGEGRTALAEWWRGLTRS